MCLIRYIGVMKIRFLILPLIFFSMGLHASLLPRYDINCDSMCTYRAKVDVTTGYHKQKVPKIIHQIWFGDHSKKGKKPQKWKYYAEKHDYIYMFWSEANLDSLKNIISSKNYAHIEFFISLGNWWCASDILRCELLKTFGGIYVDCDFTPPHKEGKSVDLGNIIPMTGLTLMTENHGRNVGASAIFVCNGFMSSSKDHPIISSMCDQFSSNIEFWFHRKNNYDAMYVTGPFLLNKILNGPVNIIPIYWSEVFNMWD